MVSPGGRPAIERRDVGAVLVAGLVAGVLDTLLAMGMHGIGLGVVYKSVASGVLGRPAFQGGLGVAALGMFLHFFIATSAAAVYFVASRYIPLLLERAVPCGLAFGVAVYFFMKDVVVPLSAARPPRFAWAGLIGHALLVGLPIALILRLGTSRGKEGFSMRLGGLIVAMAVTLGPVAGAAEEAAAKRTRMVEFRAYNLKPGSRDAFHGLVVQVLPMLGRYQIDVVAHGPSAHDDTSYYLVRAFSDLADRTRKEDAFYGSEAWKQGPRESVLALIESYTTVVLELDDDVIDRLRRKGD